MPIQVMQGRLLCENQQKNKVIKEELMIAEMLIPPLFSLRLQIVASKFPALAQLTVSGNLIERNSLIFTVEVIF